MNKTKKSPVDKDRVTVAEPELWTHVSPAGSIRMVDISEKLTTLREAVARGRIRISPKVMRLIQTQPLQKGNVMEIARIAGIMAAKRTAEIIPLCHSLSLNHIRVDLFPDTGGFDIEAVIRTNAQTGAEMEALHAVTVAALTVYDMVKALDKTMQLTDIRLMKKTGGKSGDFQRSE